MTGVFRAEHRPWIGLGLGSLMMLWVGAASGQETDSPLILMPGTAPTTPVAEQPDVRPTAPADGALPFGAPRGAETPAGRVGLPQETFGPDLWKDSDWAVIEKLFRGLPTQIRSAVANSLLQRLLATNAAMGSMFSERTTSTAAGETEPAATRPETGHGAERLIYYRLSTLLRRGQHGMVIALARDMPEPTDPDIARVEAEALFLAQDLDRACGHVRRWRERSGDDFWVTALAFCELKERASAQSMAALATEGDTVGRAAAPAPAKEKAAPELPDRQEAPDGNVLKALTDWNAKDAGPVESIRDLEPLEMTILHHSNSRYDGKPDLDAEPWHLRAAAENSRLRPEVRIRAAEEAEHLGALPPGALRHLYGKLTATEGLLRESIKRGSTDRDPGPKGRALLAGLIAEETQSGVAVELINRYLEASRFHGRPTQGMRVVYPYVKLLKVDRELVWFAPHAVRILLLHNDLEPARQWLDLLRAEAAGDASLAEILERLGPLTWISGLVDPGRELQRALIQWHGMEKRRDPKGAVARVNLAVALLEALDNDISSTVLQSLMTGQSDGKGSLPMPYLLALNKAAENQRVGETILLVMLTLGEGDLSKTNPMTLSYSVKALNTLGLVLEARALAVEAALVGGL